MLYGVNFVLDEMLIRLSLWPSALSFRCRRHRSVEAANAFRLLIRSVL